uniref:Uncharacterized protein n=1 Tax=Arundo donax TaxID=35708 RepID=A0A0A8YX85_ARUDO
MPSFVGPTLITKVSNIHCPCP